MVDVNGDGKADLCARGSAGVSCAISTGTSFGALSLWQPALAAFSNANGWNNVQNYSTIRFGDLNRDHRADVCGRTAFGVYCALSNGSSAFGPLTQWQRDFSDANGWASPEYYTTIALADLDGD